ncbi:MAG: AGE family epimerase/isomerase, partial [Phycisphaerales bacterium]|nr:AGE family epimerase/isomerase [Phycisphaerales bacterium]
MDREMDEAWAMYERMVVTIMLKIIERTERDPAYGFIDTKVDLISGEDFSPDDELRGKGTIYAWIQGRGLEALAGHAKLVGEDRIKPVAARVMERMEELRAAAGGLSFMMRPTGEMLAVRGGQVVVKERGGASNVSDLFYGKGLAATAAMLGDERRLEEAKRILWRAVEDVRAGRFESDQEQLDSRNPVGPVAGRSGHGARMLLVGAAALMVELTKDEEWAEMGREMIEHVLRWHVDIERGTFDMWEFVDTERRPYLEDGKLRSDPGHATEFVGLSLKFLRVCEGTCSDPALRGGVGGKWRDVLGKVLRRNFENGFSKKGMGMYKAFDLIFRKPMNTDMPWWNLPETMRAGMEAAACTRDEVERERFLAIVRQCSNAFMKYFVRADRWLMANQTVDENGDVVARVPATPDADPGYHTGLSLIDCLRVRG